MDSPSDTVFLLARGAKLNIMKNRNIMLGFAVGVGLFAAGELPAEPDARGLTNMVLQDCGSCHGMTLRGGLGPGLRPEDLEPLPVEAIAAIIREGVAGTAMPPWKGLLSDEEILWVSRQLKSGAFLEESADRQQ
jgi:cytochrome c55X